MIGSTRRSTSFASGLCRLGGGVFLAVCVLLLAAGASADTGGGKIVELQKNGGFEQVKGGRPEGWRVSNAGVLSCVTDAHSGKFAARFESRYTKEGACWFNSIPWNRVDPNGTYRVSLWAKGKGQAQVVLSQTTKFGRGMFIGSHFFPTFNLTPEWKKVEFVYKPKDARTGHVCFYIRLWGKDRVAFFDDASFTFNPDENPGIAIEEPVVTRPLRIQVKSREATASLLVNGKQIGRVNGVGTVEISEGITAIAVKAEAKGENPGVSVKIPDHPETDGRWRVGTREENGWREPGFDDKAWKVATPNEDGYVWHREGGAGSALLRQVILWNETHYGPNRCILPPAKQWGFPRGGLEVLHLALYSPLPYGLDEYEFTLDVPQAFELIGKTDYTPRWKMNVKPQRLLTEKAERDGIAYTRYRMWHSPKHVIPDETHYSMLPLKMVGEPQERTCGFYYRRSARGNFTELDQFIPVEILPPVNGRMPKHVIISQYNWTGYSNMSGEHLEAFVQQAATAGWNYWNIGYVPGWGQQWRDYLKSGYEAVTRAGGRIMILPAVSCPLNIGYSGAGHCPHYAKWLEETVEAHGRFFNDTPAWGSKGPYTRPYCNQYVITEGREAFEAMVKREYGDILKVMPKADLFWTDWEHHHVKRDGTGSHCFCKRCKEAFRKFAKLPQSADLSDEAIVREHRLKWETFRHHQDGQIQGIIRKVCNELGRPYMVYSWAGHNAFWKVCKGRIDLAFPGLPGNAPADSHRQSTLDSQARFFRENVGLKRVVGQRFSFFPGRGKNGWQALALSWDGCVDAKSWKGQVLRMAASLHGGMDFQDANKFCAGMHYYVGEATRIISAFEPLFWEGERADDLAASEQIKYPNLLVLRLGKERLVLLFNEGKEPLNVVLENKGLEPGQVGTIFDKGGPVANPAKMKVTVPPEDCVVVHVK